MEYYKGIVSPALDHLDSERMHVAARESLHWVEKIPFGLSIAERFAYHRERFRNERLKIDVGGIEFENPVMVGAGWDKLGHAVKGLYQLGFSGVEVGSVLLNAQPGNDKPRQFMVGRGVALNRLGFNSPGMYKIAQNLERYQQSGIPMGISIGKNKVLPDHISDPNAYALVAAYMNPYATYFAVNVSSPNTPGLRALQDREPLTNIIQAVQGTFDNYHPQKPIFIKIAPDLETEDVDVVIDIVLQNNLAGIIATNTTNNPYILERYG
ncbi:MAG: dihydroorotate dehydrogenase (quinone), partial [Patescibacteria group bacterium]